MFRKQQDVRNLAFHPNSRRKGRWIPNDRRLRMEALEERNLLAAPFGWAVRTGSSGDDGGVGLTLNQDGTLFVAGYFSGSIDANPGSGNFPLTSSGLQDAFGAIYSGAGVFATALGYGSSTSDDQGWVGLPASGGGAYCALQLGNAIDIVRFDQYGNTPWWDWIGSSGSIYVRDMAFGQYGDLYITGQFTDTVDFDPGYQNHSLTSVGAEDVFVLCLATNGSYLWAKSFGGPGDDKATQIAIADDYSIFLAGSFTGTADFNPSASANTLTSAGASDAYVAKFDASGNYLWARGMGGSDSDVANGLARASDGSLYVVGSFRGTADFDPGGGVSLLTAAGGDDAFVTKLDAGGNLAWAAALRGTATEVARSVAVTSTGVCVAGEFTGSVDFNPSAALYTLTAVPVTNSFVCQLTSTGLFDGAESFGMQGDVRVRDIAVAADGGIYATGTLVGTGDFDPGAATVNLTSAGGSDLFLAKLPTPVASDNTLTTAQDLGVLGASTVMLTEFVGNSDTEDYYRFQIPLDGPVTVSVSGLTADVDLQWVSNTGSVLGTVSHVGATDEIATATFGGNWPYYLRVYRVSGDTNYSLSLTRGGIAGFDTAGNSIGAARDFGTLSASASELYEYVGTGDSDDYFRFQQPGEGPVTVSVSGLTANVDLQWLSNTGAVLGTVSHAGTTDEVATATFGANWPYYLRVYSVSGSTSYTLSLTRGGVSTFDTAGNSIAAARDLGTIRASASEMYEYVGSGDADDYYCFRQPSEGPVTVSVSGLGANVDLQWLSDTGVVLGTVSHAGTTDEIATATFGGNWPYYLRVYSVSGGNTNYTLALSRGGLSTFDTAGNSIASARDLGNLRASASEMYEYVGSADTDDYYCFQQPGEGPVTVSVSGLTADVDLQWLSDTGAVLGTVSHAGATDEIATATFGPNWPYYLRVYSVSGGNTSYTLALSRGGLSTFDTAGNSIASARDLGNLRASASEMYEYVGTADTDDYFCFRQAAEGPVTVSVSGLSADVDLQWLSDTGVVLGTVSHAANTDEIATATFGGNWPYYLRVFSVSGGSTNYTLSLSRGGTATFDTAGSSLNTARDLGNITASNAQVIEYVGASDTQDYFRFQQPVQGLMTITLTGLTANADLQVLNDTGSVVASSTNSGTSNESIALTFGGNWPYYIRVYQASGNTSYTLNLTKGAPLLAAEGIGAATPGSVLADESLIVPILQTAWKSWGSLGPAWHPIRVVVADLAGMELAWAVNDTIYLDRDAAGHGWFIDPTPTADEEFTRLGSTTQLTAIDARAVDTIDLLTVIEHELGHLAGLRDLDASATSLMSGALATGVRRLVPTKEIDALFAQ